MAGLVRGEAPQAGPYQGTEAVSPELGERVPARRGTTNGNVRGNQTEEDQK